MSGLRRRTLRAAAWPAWDGHAGVMRWYSEVN